MPPLAALPPLLLVMAGGAAGAGLRFTVVRWSVAILGTGLPFGTWLVNIGGSLALGLLIGTLGRLGDGGEGGRLLLGVGVLGGFTTFAWFSFDVVEMILRGDLALATAYIVSSVAGSVVALYAGLLLARG